MSYSLLKDLASHTQKWRVKVRVVRFSESLSNDEPPKVNRLDFVLLDEKGTAMEAQIPGRWLPLLKDCLTEDKVYYIESFEVTSSRPSYRPVRHPYAAKFTRYTKIKECTAVSDTFPLYACDIVPFATLMQRVDETDYMSDTIGLITECEPPRVQDTSTGRKKMRRIYITDGSETVPLTLWKEHAHRFEAEQITSMSKQGPVAVLFVGLTAKWRDGRLQLQGSPTCRWYINPAIPEAIALQDRCAYMMQPVKLVRDTVGTAIVQPATVTDLSSIEDPHQIWGNKYIVNVQIKQMLAGHPWWYMGCIKCLRKSRPYGDIYKCNTPKCTGTIAEPRYCLSLLAVEPGTLDDPAAPNIDLVCFGPTAEQLVGAPVLALLDAGGNAEGFVPPPIARCFGRRYQLRLSVPQAALSRDRPSFKIDAIEGVPAIVPPKSVDEQTGTSNDAANQSLAEENDILAAAVTYNTATPSKEILAIQSADAPPMSEDKSPDAPPLSQDKSPSAVPVPAHMSATPSSTSLPPRKQVNRKLDLESDLPGVDNVLQEAKDDTCGENKQAPQHTGQTMGDSLTGTSTTIAKTSSSNTKGKKARLNG